ncbi:MAG: GNAT family N-acetyltransferase [Promethearchaeota archaeon]
MASPLFIVRASREMMGRVRAIIRSNADLYRDIVQNEDDWLEHDPKEEWEGKNFPIREFYLARHEGEYVATGSYQVVGDFAYVGYLYVERQFHGRGYGRALLRFIEARAKADGINDLRLFCNPGSDWALGFYEKLGFHVLTGDKGEILAVGPGVMRPYYEEGALLLQKILEN